MSAFALENFSPADVRFKLKRHGDQEFVVDGDPDLEDIAQLLRIEQTLEEPAASDEDLLNVAREGRDLILRMIQDRDPNVTSLKMGPTELRLIICLIVRGSSVAAIVAEALLAPAAAAGSGEGSNTAEAPSERAGEGPELDTVPLASASGSPGSSFSSEQRSDGRQAIGVA